MATALRVSATKSECFEAEARIPRRAGLGEFLFRNISYVRKAANCLVYEVFAARQKELILAPLNSRLQLWPKEAREQAVLKSWLLADSCPTRSMRQALKCPIRVEYDKITVYIYIPNIYEETHYELESEGGADRNVHGGIVSHVEFFIRQEKVKNNT